MKKSILLLCFLSITVSALADVKMAPPTAPESTASSSTPNAPLTPTSVPLALEAGVRYTVTDGTRIRFKSASEISSATARKDDIFEFKVAEDVYAPREEEVKDKDGNTEKRTVYTKVIAKDASLFGTVREAKHRRFPFQGGTLIVEIKEIQAINGTPIKVTVHRPRMTTVDPKDAIRGRKNTAVAPLVPALAGTAATMIKDDSTRDVAILSLVSNTSLVDVFNGTDAKIANNEIFYAFVNGNTDVYINTPAK